MTDHGIAGTAHDLVYGERAKTYGHPRIDFDIIANIWTGLLKDKLKDGVRLDPYRVAVLMTGLKLARLVQSPEHKDSRIDTIGYMLTMERLDEVDADEPAVTVSDEPVTWTPPRNYGQTLVTGDYGDPAESLQDLAETEIYKFIDAKISEMPADTPVTNFEHPVNNILRGHACVEDAQWNEGDRIERLDKSLAWLYSYHSNVWYPQMAWSEANAAERYRVNLPVEFEHLRENAPLLVTSGVYTGLLILKDGVGYVAER